MIENLLTIEEIREVLEIARLNPALRHPDVSSFGKERTSIFKISKKGIIFIKGDSHTGFTHINERHSFWSESYYWKKEEGKTKLDDPSKFSRKSIPIGDYIRIADVLFSDENLNIEKNKRPELFEMYSGIVEDGNNGKMKYHMLIYRETKIIHTLFPHSKVHNKKKYIDYRRGKSKGEFWLNPLRSTIAIPYLDDKDMVVFSFQVMKDFVGKIETGVLINHKLNKNVILYEREIEKIKEFNADVEMMDCADLSEIERIIKRLDEQEI